MSKVNDMTPATGAKTSWNTRSGFVLATIGSAVGIGSIWKFPYEVGANGGGAFVLVYIVGLSLVVVPLMLAEFALGRRGRSDAPTSIAAVAVSAGASRRWGSVGVLGAVTSFVILSFYAVIGGWALSYAVDTLFSGLPTGAAAVETNFEEFLASPWRIMVFQVIFLAMVTAVVIRGVQSGIERSMKVLMPALAVLLVALAAYSLATGDAGEAIRFLFVPNFGDLDGQAVLDALGLGFFSIGAGLGILLTYASYSPPGVDLRSAAVVSVAGDTAISLTAGLAIFPVVFANDLDPASGPGLAFVSLPLAFEAMPGGRWAAVAFFTMLAIAALGSAVSMLEAVVAPLSGRTGDSRVRATLLAATTCAIAGLATVLSFNHWSDIHPLGFVDRYADATIYALVDDAASQLLLPLGGLLIATLVGWIVPDQLLREELRLHGWPLSGLRFALRWIAPAVIFAAVMASVMS